MDFVDFAKFKKTMLEFKETEYTPEQKAAVQIGITPTKAQFDELLKENVEDTAVWTKQTSDENADLKYKFSSWSK